VVSGPFCFAAVSNEREAVIRAQAAQMQVPPLVPPKTGGTPVGMTENRLFCSGTLEGVPEARSDCLFSLWHFGL
jgi:hypothetical protein